MSDYSQQSTTHRPAIAEDDGPLTSRESCCFGHGPIAVEDARTVGGGDEGHGGVLVGGVLVGGFLVGDGVKNRGMRSVLQLPCE